MFWIRSHGMALGLSICRPSTFGIRIFPCELMNQCSPVYSVSIFFVQTWLYIGLRRRLPVGSNAIWVFSDSGAWTYGKPNLMTQEGFLTTLIEVDAFDSPAQAFTSENGVSNARGRVLGGSSTINAGFYSRADQDFYGRSRVNWDLRVVNQSYEWVERAIVFRPELKNWQSAVRDGLLEAGVDPYN